ncbi:hypothetical protein GCM10028819_38660 [Spirosoma humi]
MNSPGLPGPKVYTAQSLPTPDGVKHRLQKKENQPKRLNVCIRMGTMGLTESTDGCSGGIDERENRQERVQVSFAKKGRFVSQNGPNG